MGKTNNFLEILEIAVFCQRCMKSLYVFVHEKAKRHSESSVLRNTGVHMHRGSIVSFFAASL